MPASEYLTEIFYPSHFYDFMSPVLLNYLAALHGFPPRPLVPGFTYCELACGGGNTLNTLAASYPQGRFSGIDFNPAHIAYARQNAEDAGLENLQFIEADINQLDFNSLPRFDFITLHGLYSWVGPDTRQRIQAFLAQCLKPGGLVMISYNAQPGASLIQPIREMMLAYTAGMADPAEKVSEGIRYLNFLIEQGATYFQDNPYAAEAVKDLLARDRDYLAHEFFNTHWTPFYFSEVAQEMAAAGLSFVAGFPLASNYLQASVPTAFHEFFLTAPDRLTLERHKAFVRNDRFRRDVYIQAEGDYLPEAQRLALFEPFYFGSEYFAVEKQITLRAGAELSLDFTGQPASTVADTLLAQPMTVPQLCACPALLRENPHDLLYAVNLLVLGGYFRPFAAPAPMVQGHGGRIRIPLSFNRWRLQHCLDSDSAYVYLASPVAGDGLAINLLDALLLGSLADTGCLDATPNHAWVRLQAAGKELQVLDLNREELEEENDPLALLSEHLAGLVTQRLGKYLQLGLAEAVGGE